MSFLYFRKKKVICTHNLNHILDRRSVRCARVPGVPFTWMILGCVQESAHFALRTLLVHFVEEAERDAGCLDKLLEALIGQSDVNSKS